MMIKTSLRLFFKNLWKNKTYSLINILGLAIGMASFIVGLLYLNNQWSYDKGFKDFKDIYRIEVNNADGSQYLAIPQNISQSFLEGIPEITTLTKFSRSPIVQPLLKMTDRNTYVNNFYFADSSFFHIFNFHFIYGSIGKALSSPKAIVLSKETSFKLFQDSNPVGKSILIGSEGDFEPLIVTGVFDNKKFPTHLSVDAVKLMELPKGSNNFKPNPTYAYVKLNSNANVSLLEKKMASVFNEMFLNQNSNNVKLNSESKSITLQPLASIYLHSHTKEDPFKSGSQTSIWLISCLITFMLLVSAINFTNLNIAEVPSKAKEIAIRKILGSSQLNTLKQLYFETSIKCLLALTIAVIIIKLISPMFNSIFNTSFSLFETSNITIWIQIVGLLIVLILMIGTYPVLIISRFSSSTILKGNFIHNLKGKAIANILLVVQFIIASVFIIGIFIISSQIQFLRNKNIGFNPQQILILKPGKIQTQFQYPVIKNELFQIPGIENISYASAVGTPNEQTVMHLTINGEEYTPQYLCVDTGYFNLMGTHILKGRNFSEDIGDSLNSLIINESMADEIGIKDIDKLDEVKVFKNNARIIGIVRDINFYGFENKIPPMVFTTKKITLTPFILLKLSTKNIGSTVAAIQNKWKNIEPSYPLRYQFFDQSFQEIFEYYEKTNKLFHYLTFTSLFIALIGIFTMAYMASVQRAKEIAIRKVVGASLIDIFKLMNQKFVTVILFANVFAWPIVYFLSEKWLNNFAYRIQISFAPFLFAVLITLSLTISTVCIQTLGVASSNPTVKLKQE